MAGESPVQLAAVERLFEREKRTGGARWFSLPGGSTLFGPGEMADDLFLVHAGKLGAFREPEGGERTFLGVIRPGQPAGEMAMISGTRHTSRVVALRDSEVLALPREVFFDAVDQDPEVMNELARLMILRARQTSGRPTGGEPTVFGFVAEHGCGDIRALIAKVARAVAEMGHSVTLVGSESASAPTEWYSAVEADHEYVFYVAQNNETGWRSTINRQVDRLFRVGRGDRPAPLPDSIVSAEPLQSQALVDLILIQSPAIDRPSGSEEWIEATGAARLFHLREGHAADAQRMARTLTGRSVGLVLSGGGARAYAHIGALRALRKSGVPIDFVGGASMGAIIAACVAMGWGEEELEYRIRKAFVETSPLDDIALPLIALTHGVKVKQRLKEHFGDALIPDLWLPFFCISSNLTTGAYQVHQRGRVRNALRASIALPGVMPPFIQGDEVLVDGAVLKNYPADVMRSLHLGPVVGVDVTRGVALTAADVARPPLLKWILSGEWRKGPPIVGVLMRAATLSTNRDALAARDATDLLMLPEVDHIDLRDWTAFDAGADAGYAEAMERLEGLTRPVTELRRARPGG